jgi:hypothetical protein
MDLRAATWSSASRMVLRLAANPTLTAFGHISGADAAIGDGHEGALARELWL